MAIFSPIQNRIISKLKKAEFLRYRDLQEEGVPNDLFNYHLQFLVKKGFIVRSPRGYELTPAGIKHVADPDFSFQDRKATSLFKVNVITIVSRSQNGKLEILNQVRKSHPSFGKIGVPGGLVRKGESIIDAAARKLKVETGLDADFKFLGIERRMMYIDGTLFSDIYFPIAYANSSFGELKEDTEFGHNMWVGIAQAIKNESAEFDTIKKITDVLRAIKKGTVGSLPFFYKENIQSK